VTTSINTAPAGNARYESRVWGRHLHARRLLAGLADKETTEQADDCYLLVDDTSWNAKVRDNTLKVKRLVAQRKGFERWTSNRHDVSNPAPVPFDTLAEQLGLNGHRGDADDLAIQLAAFGVEADVRLVFVAKRRRRYRVGQLKGEATDITILETGEVLHTLSIEGDDLNRLVALRKRLGLRGEDNVAVHNALRRMRSRVTGQA
jgi:hypothetical protein